MRRLSLAVIAFSIAIASNANGQIPGRLKREAEKALKKKLSDKDKQAGDESRSRPPAYKGKDRKYAPGLSFSTVLNGVLLLARDGQFRLHHIQGTFLPPDCKEGFTVLRTADGKELYQFDWKIETLKAPYSLLSTGQATDLSSGENVSGGVSLGTPGDYVLDFYTPSEHFYTFPFSVVKLGDGDPFGAGDCYTLNGDWQDYGYLFYGDAKPDQNLQWKVWLRNEGCEEKSIKVHIEITRDADGELVCTSRENMTHSAQPQWTRIAFDMVFPKGKEVPFGTYFKAKDLLDTDGAYTLTMKIDEETYGVWKFAVEGGKLNYKGRTERGKADPLKFIEGGRDAWWYAKEK